MVAGAVLHDVGRVVEFDAELTSPGLTIESRLTGHLILGRAAGTHAGDLRRER